MDRQIRGRVYLFSFPTNCPDNNHDTVCTTGRHLAQPNMENACRLRATEASPAEWSIRHSPMLRKSASGHEIGLPGRFSPGF